MTSPHVPAFPLRMRDTEILTVAYRTTPEAVAAFLPPQLEPLGPRVFVHLYRMHDAEWFGRYGESAIQLPARHVTTGTEGAFSPLLFVESDGAIAAGREIYGQPKKGGTIELAADGDLLVGRLRRNGIGVLTATMPYKQERAAAADLDALGFRNINLKRTAQAPVHLLPVLEVEEAFHWRVDFTLTYGRVFEDLA